jgi:N-acetylmuramoyl-L-alanine amidase
MSFLPPFTYLQPARRHPYSVSMTLPKRMPAAPLPRVYGDASRPLVVIDAGHGGHDPGALSADGGLREKDVTLEVAKAIKDALLASGRVRVALTREDDRFLVLQERYGLARRLKADLFISVHCDSAGNADATGATVYTLSEVASDKEAARLAARENKADIIAGVDLGVASPDISSILIDLTQRETMNMSRQFRPIARPRGPAADADQGQLPPHGVADGAQGARHAVGAVRDRLYLEPADAAFLASARGSAKWRRACARRWRSISPRAWPRADPVVPG